MELSSDGVIHEALSFDWFVPCVVSKDSLFVPFALELVSASPCLIQLLVQQGVALQDFFFLAPLNLLNFGEFLLAVLFFTLFFEFFVLSEQLSSVIFLT